MYSKVGTLKVRFMKSEGVSVDACHVLRTLVKRFISALGVLQSFALLRSRLLYILPQNFQTYYMMFILMILEPKQWFMRIEDSKNRKYPVMLSILHFKSKCLHWRFKTRYCCLKKVQKQKKLPKCCSVNCAEFLAES